MSKELYYIDTETGEIEPFVGTAIADKQREAITNNYMRNMQYADGPAFIWIMFRYGEQLFPGMQPANLTRLIYAATFCDGNGRLIPKSDLRKQMKLSKDAWCSFWNDMKERNIFYIKDGCVYLDTSHFTKWSINPNINQNFTRLYCNCVRNLYDSCTRATDHKKMSYIFKIIPFVNRKFNIVCKNPWETDKTKLNPMSVGDFCETLGLDRSHARRVLKDLLDVKVNGVPVMYFAGNSLKEETWKLFICPNMYYGGDYGINRNEVLDSYKRLIES